MGSPSQQLLLESTHDDFDARLRERLHWLVLQRWWLVPAYLVLQLTTNQLAHRQTSPAILVACAALLGVNGLYTRTVRDIPADRVRWLATVQLILDLAFSAFIVAVDCEPTNTAGYGLLIALAISSFALAHASIARWMLACVAVIMVADFTRVAAEDRWRWILATLSATSVALSVSLVNVRCARIEERLREYRALTQTWLRARGRLETSEDLHADFDHTRSSARSVAGLQACSEESVSLPLARAIAADPAVRGISATQAAASADTALWYIEIRLHLRSVQSYARAAFALAFSGAVLGVMIEGVLQFNESRQESALAWRIVNDAHAQDPRSRVIALRDYIRRHVSYHGAPIETRPFLRATALETLHSGLGWCGDVSRTFIVLSQAVGIHTQRIDLDGSHTHVVAEANIGLPETVVVDSQNPPHIPDLEPLSVTLRRPEYTTYYTMNLRRLHLGAVTHLRIKMGLLTYWTENPHALKALFWGMLAAVLVSVKGVRWSLRHFLLRRGWVHRETVQEGVNTVR